ncbi:MAG: efflux RND transporter periplasmic adaptor subunit [Candidatus Omnitrophica bacterium]|nr:efflux RND transporter periplasmic adaptor subunit [Candidatus Omnitrophota bacterium]
MSNPKLHSSKDKFLGYVLLYLIFCLVMGVILGCQQKELPKQKEEDIIAVKVLKVELRDIFESLEYVGNIKAEEEALVYPKVSGKIIEKVKIEGQEISKTESIVYIDRDEVGLVYEKAPVEAPLDGIVGRVYVDVGQHVTPQTPIALILSMDKVKIVLDIPERYLARIALGLKARIQVDSYPEEEFWGKVNKVIPVVDLATRTAPVEIVLDNPKHRLKSGMFARVGLILEERRAVPVILKESIITRDQDSYVYIVENNRAVLKKVRLGLKQGPYYQVLEGIKEKDLVVIMGQQRLTPGAKVKFEE